MTVEEICRRAKEASYALSSIDTNTKNDILVSASCAIEAQAAKILAANETDIKLAREKGLAQGLLDRLLLTEDRIRQIAEGIRQVASLEDPIGEVLSMKKRPNGLLIGQKRVPMGVIGVIYEARPNVTADVFALCFKTSNAVVLKGGSDALSSNRAFVSIFRDVLQQHGQNPDDVALIEETDRSAAQEFMRMDAYVDLLIPRGGAGLIRSVVQHSTIPVIQTGTGNCHIYIDEGCDISMALDIVENAKTQRIGVCNAAESLVVHEKELDRFLPALEQRLKKHHVELRADEKAGACLADAVAATEEDWGREYLDYKLSIKTVSSLDEAIAHINHYNTGHSEAIVTENYEHAQRFLNEIDAACVYVNASTRFTDGFEFGFGAEIGISTQKLHARGPMGLLALTSTKYIIYGNGQIRS